MRTRLRAAWNALCGRPTVFNAHIESGTLVFNHTAKRAYVANTVISGSAGAGIHVK